MAETIKEIQARVKKAQKEYYSNLSKIESILMHERHFISRLPTGEDVVVPCSGGLDSVVMINMIIEEWNVKVHPLYIRRGARSEKFEEQAFDFFKGFYKDRFPENMGEATKLDYEIPPKQFKEYFPKELALTVGHPLRNSTIQNLAVMYAVALNGKLGTNIKTILTGSVGEDNTEPELGILSLRAQTLNTCINMADWEWQVTSPLIDTTLRKKSIYKTDLIEYALRKSIPLEKTRTCFSADETADGTCFACKKRLDAFDYLGIKDPLKYQRRDYNGKK